SSIASSYGVSWKKLAEYNSISNPNQLKVGQELRIPGSSSVISSSSTKHVAPVSSRPAAASIKPGPYVIQKGDKLSTIAKRSGLTVAEIKAANDLKSDSLVVGKKITIPKKGEAKAPAAAKEASAKAAKSAPAAKAAADSTLPAAAPIVDAAAPAATASTGAVTKVAAPAASAAAANPAAKAAAPVATAASAPVYEHVLYPGETLYDVARQYGSSQQ
ncbi:MAG: LysM peptidoglycan-binding domain-containing protein, partial [Kiritimatiellales bacterium]